MTWKRLDNLSKYQFARRGMAKVLISGSVCRQAELLFPGMFTAVSLNRGTLKLLVTPEKLLPTTLIKGDILAAVNTYCNEQNIGKVTHISLTTR